MAEENEEERIQAVQVNRIARVKDRGPKGSGQSLSLALFDKKGTTRVRVHGGIGSRLLLGPLGANFQAETGLLSGPPRVVGLVRQGPGINNNGTGRHLDYWALSFCTYINVLTRWDENFRARGVRSEGTHQSRRWEKLPALEVPGRRGVGSLPWGKLASTNQTLRGPSNFQQLSTGVHSLVQGTVSALSQHSALCTLHSALGLFRRQSLAECIKEAKPNINMLTQSSRVGQLPMRHYGIVRLQAPLPTGDASTGGAVGR
ncbi:hypothetical protein E4U59_004132 [Claviceps monticola]|nr:hypothetical protein E4U59_004132 [Claviceps monticola]